MRERGGLCARRCWLIGEIAGMQWNNTVLLLEIQMERRNEEWKRTESCETGSGEIDLELSSGSDSHHLAALDD